MWHHFTLEKTAREALLETKEGEMGQVAGVLVIGEHQGPWDTGLQLSDLPGTVGKLTLCPLSLTYNAETALTVLKDGRRKCHGNR